MHLLDLLPGIIWSGFLGLIAGNFATSPIYRLPRGESLFLRDPYCGDCNAKLKPKDLFPVLSWLMTRGKCRYCGAAVPGAYTAIEALTCILFIVCYLQYGFSERFLLVSLGITAFLMLITMLLLDDFFSDKTLVATIVLGMLCRTLLDGTLYGFAGSAFAGLLAGIAIWRISGTPMVRDVTAFPAYLKLLLAAGVWLPLSRLAIVLLAALIAALIRQDKKRLPEITIIVCTCVLVLSRSVW